MGALPRSNTMFLETLRSLTPLIAYCPPSHWNIFLK